MAKKKPLEKAVEIVGSQASLARKLTERTGRKYSQGHVYAWLNRYPLPAEVVIPIEEIVGGQVTRTDLRPDIYPAEESDARASA